MAATIALFIGMQCMMAQGLLLNQAPSLSPYDSLMLANLPELSAIPVLKSSDLPYFLDNSRLQYYRPIYKQVSNECGQVSGIAYNFTYEMNRLRDLPANDPANQYPPHFTYNFMNGGAGWFGVSYFHSFEIVKALGCPSVTTYGGMAAGGDGRWMTGYEDYLSAMSNRIREVYQIRVNTEEGLLQLKQWLHNHLDGSDVGGVASFYANSPWNMKTLPEDSPEAGKKVITWWAGNPTHAMTITGYNDSIRYDYNQDGKYTKDLDINDDGVLDMRDWEIGGLLFADGWQGGINFGDSGRCYMMYKTLADKLYEGGIWNNAVHILDVKELEKPKLTAKIRLTHNKRNMLRIRVGISSEAKDTLPEKSISFPVFNFQGGSYYMQGGYEQEENKTIEFGLDITPLLGLLNTNTSKQFFLIVEERDPESLGTGYIEHFSVIDYSGASAVEYSSQAGSIPIRNDRTSYASLFFPESLEVMDINSKYLPAAVVGEEYSFQLEATGGSIPYKWSVLNATADIPIQAEINSTGIYQENDYTKYTNIPYALPFGFPFYGEIYDSIFISPNGLILFENTNYPWPYLRDPDLLIRTTKCIAPLLSYFLSLDTASGQGIWLKEDDDMLSIRWHGKIIDLGYEAMVDFAINMYETGKIEFVYGSELQGHKTIWSCGISKGDHMNYHIPTISEAPIIQDGDAIEIQCTPLPEEMHLSEDGLFSGSPVNYYKEVPICFCVEDDEHCRSYRTLIFSATDLGIEDHALSDKSIQAYPNPFSQKISIRIMEEIDATTDCSIFDVNARHVRMLAKNKLLHSGDIILWDGKDDAGNSCPEGIYFLRIATDRQSITKKLIFTGQ